jgi:hypothetical protein
MADALRKGVAVFNQVPAHSVDALCALTPKIPGSEHDSVRLLLLGLDRNEEYTRPLRRFTVAYPVVPGTSTYSGCPVSEV